MKQLNDIEKLRYWLDAEITLMHIGLAFIAALVVGAWWAWVLFGVYAVFAFFYAMVRIAYVIAQDKNYLKLPKD